MGPFSRCYLSTVKAVEEGSGAILMSVDENLVDKVWGSLRPPAPSSDIVILALTYSGQKTSIHSYLAE